MNQRKTRLALFLVVAAGTFAVLGSGLLWLPAAAAAAAGAAGATEPGVLQWGLMAAAVATAASSLGAGYAVAAVGAAAVGALAEKPELLGRVLILVGLAEGIAIYGVLISVLILNRIA